MEKEKKVIRIESPQQLLEAVGALQAEWIKEMYKEDRNWNRIDDTDHIYHDYLFDATRDQKQESRIFELPVPCRFETTDTYPNTAYANLKIEPSRFAEYEQFAKLASENYGKENTAGHHR